MTYRVNALATNAIGQFRGIPDIHTSLFSYHLAIVGRNLVYNLVYIVAVIAVLNLAAGYLIVLRQYVV